MVFLCGMEEGIFPSYKSIGEIKELEEERRLCYVGITRAKEYLYLTAAKKRTLFGATTCNAISRFVNEIPENMLDGASELLGKKQEEYEFQDTEYEWRYRNRKKENILDNNRQVNKIPEFQFRTAESFLQTLNRPEDKEIDMLKYKKGQNVKHSKFGLGTILAIEPEGDDMKLDIEFDKVGHKRLMARFANLEIIA